MNLIKKNGAGLLLCLIIAIPSWFLGQAIPVIGGPVFAILIGMILTLILTKKDAFTPGVNYTSKKILQAAVVFLGFGMNLTEILAKGSKRMTKKWLSLSLSFSSLMCLPPLSFPHWEPCWV